MAQLEVKKTADGKTLARRLDGRPLTPQDREEARRLADNPLTGDGALGVTAPDVLRVFGGLVIEEDKPLGCRHCNEKKGVPHWRKGGNIIRRIRADGFHVWACHFCGREARGKTL